MKTYSTMAYWAGSSWRTSEDVHTGKPCWLPTGFLAKLPTIEAPSNQAGIVLSAGRWRAYCLVDFGNGVMSVVEPGSMAAAEHCSEVARTAVRHLNNILGLDTIQDWLDPEWDGEYKETVGDRALVAALASGARMSVDGRIEGVDA